MAKTHGDRLETIEEQLAKMERSVELNRTTSDIHSEYTKAAIRELQAIVKEMQAEAVRRAEADAKFDQRCAALEKQADRGWQMWLGACGFGFGLLNLLLTAALQLKK
ncbi:MAG: hypothetical protein K2V38_23955 [Gemmataceae bacterium]|nr:hypothetical protein [Gemmataceae bacterium]